MVGLLSAVNRTPSVTEGITMSSAQPDQPTLATLYTRYGCEREPSTWSGESPGLYQFVDWCGNRGIHYPSQVTPHVAALYWAEAKGRLAESTRVTRIAQLRSFFRWMELHRVIDSNPTLVLKARKPMPPDRTRLTPETLLRLIEAAEYPQHRIVIALAANLALRGSEIRELRIRDLDLDNGLLTVRVLKTREIDKMPINTDLRVELDRWLEVYQQTPGLTPYSRLVPSQNVGLGRIVYRPDRPIAEPYAIVQRALDRIGWDRSQEGVHTIRRSVARIAFDAMEAETSFDDALLGVMRLLHHDRAETTLRYIGVDRQTQARDRFFARRPFLTRLAADTPSLRIVK
jgi:integrase